MRARRHPRKVGQVLGGDAGEAAEPSLESAVAGVDVVDVQMASVAGFPAEATASKTRPSPLGSGTAHK